MAPARKLPEPRNKESVVAFLAKLNNNPSLDKQLRDLAEWPSTPWWDRAHENPAVRAWQACLHRYNDESIRDAQFKLSECIGRLAEQPNVFAHLSAVYVYVEKKLIPMALHNHWKSESGPLTLDDECLVAKAAASGKPYYSPDVKAPNEKYYRNICNATRSELVVPIHWEGELIGAINLESSHLNGLADALPIVADVIPSMIPDILVLQSCYSDDDAWCPWNPTVHGWDLRKIMSQLLQTAGAELAGSAAKFTVWYPDWEKEELFAYATYGYDWCFVDGDSLSLPNSQIGQSLRHASQGLTRLDVGKFIKSKKAMELGIDEAWVAPICLSEDMTAPNVKPPISAITCYFASNGRPIDAIIRNERDLAKSATKAFAILLGKLIEAFQTQRSKLARAHIAAVNYAHRNQPQRTRFEEWLHAIRRIFDSPAGSVFHLKNGERLQCIASSGFYNQDRGTRSLKLATHFYDIHDEKLSHTVATLELKGKALRRLGLGHSQEKGLTDLVPEVADFHKNAEFLIWQPLNELGNSQRQLLACAYRCDGKIAGVVRLIRGKHTRPFTVCDVELIEEICKAYAPCGKSFSIAIGKA
jgi:hypothetical protein